MSNRYEIAGTGRSPLFGLQSGRSFHGNRRESPRNTMEGLADLAASLRVQPSENAADRPPLRLRFAVRCVDPNTRAVKSVVDARPISAPRFTCARGLLAF